MTDPMSTEELQACRERAEAATGLSPSDVRGGAFTWDGDEALLADVVATADALAALRADANRLLATIAALEARAERSDVDLAKAVATIRAMADERQRKIDALPDFSEPGTLNPTRERHIVARGALDDALAAIQPTVHVPDGETAPPEPRKPLAGWKASERPGEVELSTGLEAHNRGHLIARAAPSDGEFIFEIETDDVEGSQHEYQWVRGFDSLEAAQFAAEDALFAIADAINALRGGR